MDAQGYRLGVFGNSTVFREKLRPARPVALIEGPDRGELRHRRPIDLALRRQLV